mmetsp:Transcript_14295/g.23340  ORF Transcript_14295/g.23340 Transcript_14295/m.23340 type:complete len:330 (+) Transcript_14295:128-1117(+)
MASTLSLPLRNRGQAIFHRLRNLCCSNKRCLSTQEPQGSKIDFGFEKVEYGEKRERVREVFTNVASKYDLMNDAMSAGIHRLWKDDFVENIGLSALAAAGGDSPKVLDVAGGTGDIAFRILEQLQECWPDAAGAVPPGHPAGGRLAASADADADASAAAAAAAVTVFDINADMMEVGRARAGARFPPAAAARLAWVQGDAERLPFAEGTFDLYTAAFGLRNVTDKARALAEARRVLRPGGRFMCLEFSQVEAPVARQLYDLYSFRVIPPMGAALAGDAASYQYLVESIRVFPDKERLKGMMQEAGFQYAGYQSYTLGAVALHSGMKPLH